jgi:hypothetical protein
MKKQLIIWTITIFTTNVWSMTKCEQKIQNLMLAAEKINYPESAQAELSKFTFNSNGQEISATGIIFVYNGDTIYRATGHRLIYGDPSDCVVKSLTVEVLP